MVLSCLNSPEFIYSYFGTVRNGGIIVPINLLLTMEKIVYIVKDSEAKFMIMHPVILHEIKAFPGSHRKGPPSHPHHFRRGIQ